MLEAKQRILWYFFKGALTHPAKCETYLQLINVGMQCSELLEYILKASACMPLVSQHLRKERVIIQWGSRGARAS